MYSPTRFSIDFPAGADADRHQEHRKHDQHQRDAVDPQLPAEAGEQLRLLGELPLRPADVVTGPQHDAERKIDQRRRQARSSGRSALREQAGDARHQRHSSISERMGRLRVHRLLHHHPGDSRDKARAA